jgi:glycosyltransferase involved in cell wall biosynthesis
MVQPSESEALALAQLEGMALKRPLVVSDVGGNTVAVEHGVTGLVVPPRNPAALADAILRLLDDPDLRRAMGSAGRVRVEHLFDSRHNVGRLINSYHRLVS